VSGREKTKLSAVIEFIYRGSVFVERVIKRG